MAILRTVLQKLTPAEPQPPAPVGEPPVEVPAPLRELFERRQLLKVTVANAPGTYQSLILALDPRRGFLWLDDLFPNRALLKPGDELEVSHHRAGKILAFRTTVVALGQHCGVAGLAVVLPKAAHYRPRRQWPRLTLAGQPRVPVTLSLPGVGPQHGQILNMSAGGLRVSLTGDWRTQLRHGEEIPLCEFTVAPGVSCRCRARVCAFQIQNRPWRQTQISLAFVGLDDATVNNLQHYILSRLLTDTHRAA
ncbi:flagellar brake protein [Marinimicrobium sp. ABcell2]|uniref:flagellar brake protein n=1 Tax=Marinimicrobium sp. ABcell2 TaxID=3069751 RepID=UPI0027B4792A|nr:PilZ domain-containing protein [Marinimicrobium sp. ABcell2]MDQ2075454.1 flagellar brake protein [Marinimicrobium sp. ABcell2]